MARIQDQKRRGIVSRLFEPLLDLYSLLLAASHVPPAPAVNGYGR